METMLTNERRCVRCARIIPDKNLEVWVKPMCMPMPLRDDGFWLFCDPKCAAEHLFWWYEKNKEIGYPMNPRQEY